MRIGLTLRELVPTSPKRERSHEWWLGNLSQSTHIKLCFVKVHHLLESLIPHISAATGALSNVRAVEDHKGCAETCGPQLRTLVLHAWAEPQDDFGYKSGPDWETGNLDWVAVSAWGADRPPSTRLHDGWVVHKYSPTAAIRMREPCSAPHRWVIDVKGVGGIQGFG